MANERMNDMHGIHATPTDLADLARRVSVLWSTEPTAVGDDRIVLLSTLTETELDIERLQVRAATIGQLDAVDTQRTHDVAHHLDALERSWRSSVPPPALGDRGSAALR